MLKSQDVVVLLKLVAGDDPKIPFNRLASEIGLSPAEVHDSLRRSQMCGLVRLTSLHQARRGPQAKEVNRAALREFLVHGIRYVFPPERGGETRGLPTGVDSGVLPDMEQAGQLPAVWPDPEGTVRGLEFQPLYPCVPWAAKRDERFYQLLALVDVLRAGRARERRLAQQELERRLAEHLDAHQ